MSKPRIYLLGHAHIDAAWLWPIEETKEVCRDTFRSVLEFMKSYGGFTFCQSSACYYEWMEKLHPELMEEVKRRVEEGRWEVVGGSWVEFDTNIPSGESLARQFLYGQRYFKERFGFYVEVGWLPDSFGFTWTLPQIMVKSGIRYFLTQKLRWNDMAVFPYRIFWWRSPDGSKVLAYQTLGSYSEYLSDLSLEGFRRMVEILRFLHGVEELLVLFGAGDHGGGPRESDLKNARRWVEEGVTSFDFSYGKALDYFRRLEALSGRLSYPTVSDELYLQFHRGVLTSQAEVKLFNRLSEVKLENAEKVSVLASFFGFDYPRGRLGEAWKTVLLYQFHDIVSGTSIEEVYEECRRGYRRVIRDLDAIIEDALEAISSEVDTAGEGEPLLVFNTVSWSRRGVLEFKAGDGNPVEILDSEGRPVVYQRMGDGRLLLLSNPIPSLGYEVYRVRPVGEWKSFQTDVKAYEEEDKVSVENSRFKVSVDRETGVVSEVYDKLLGRNVLGCRGARIQVFDDKPSYARWCVEAGFPALSCDAWEVYIYDQLGGVSFVELDKPEEVEIVESGPVRASILVRYRFTQEGREDSVFKVYVRVYSEQPFVEFDFDVDWHAANKLAKFSFHLPFRAEYSTAEIPYGFIERRTHLSPNASLYEKARYEAACQRWVDVSSESDGFGVSILNDSKYGYDHTGGEVRMTILRSPRYPPRWKPGLRLSDFVGRGEFVDQGRHRFRFAFYPHRGGWREGGTVNLAYEYNNPLIAKPLDVHRGRLPARYSFIEVKPRNVVLSAVKKAEDRETVILRLYEAYGKPVEAELKLPFEEFEAYETDILERRIRPLQTSKGRITLKIGSCEIKTLEVSAVGGVR